MDDKRAHDRFTLWLPVRIDAQSGRVEAVCRDASAGGILVEGSADLAVGDPVTVAFRPSPDHDQVFILGRIVRVAGGTSPDGTRAMAIEFVRAVPELEALVRPLSSPPPSAGAD